jgi:hypothetical protein
MSLRGEAPACPRAGAPSKPVDPSASASASPLRRFARFDAASSAAPLDARDCAISLPQVRDAHAPSCAPCVQARTARP